MLELDHYRRQQERPPGSAVMYQKWRSLVFLHFACEPEEVQRLLPPGLMVDTFPDATGREKAWVGLVPFRMTGIRPKFLPAIPPLSRFPETNVRTYVHREGKDPGVWFFSLDAASPTACKIARATFGLPYREATMRVEDRGHVWSYASRRWAGPADCRVEAQIGDRLPNPEPGSLEFWLVERYVLFAQRRGQLLRGQIHHSPYPLRSAKVITLEESLVSAAGLAARPFIHACASDGVDVEVFAPTLV